MEEHVEGTSEPTYDSDKGEDEEFQRVEGDLDWEVGTEQGCDCLLVVRKHPFNTQNVAIFYN